MTSLEQEFISQIEQHKGILFKISKMYMTEKDDRDDLFQEITYQVWKAYSGFRGESEFSEPETRAIRDLCNKYRFQLVQKGICARFKRLKIKPVTNALEE